jgi:isovaleryl-CoA dehydrogenase
MASLLCPRALSHGIRVIGRRRLPLAAFSQRRNASSKHPKGFVPPTQDDLLELQESVQEFTSMFRRQLKFSKRQRL